ncbi:hypothetical protein BKA69DRAFT_1037237 [Paraphysoderma sedebokerense]|nr:hypothetical protein BKA69DRAFT_1037237 [Paraphysoderma sedebokerense]
MALKDQLNKLYTAVMNSKDQDGRSRSEVFVDLPSRTEYPDYYKVIKNPISLSIIKGKIDSNAYTSVNDLVSDFELMFSNCKTYNVPGSFLYQDATDLTKLVHRTIAGFGSGSKGKGSETIVKISLGKKDNKEKSRSDGGLPKMSSKEYRELYTFIENGDYKSVKTLVKSKYFDPNKLNESDLFGSKFTWAPIHCAAYYGDIKMFNLFMEYNGNVELRDTWYTATPLLWAAFGGHVEMCKALIEQYGADQEATNSGGQKAHELISDPDDPKWIGVLLKTSKKPGQNITDSPMSKERANHFQRIMQDLLDKLLTYEENDRLLSTWFLELVSKKEYPDYYQTITHPMSFNIIQKNLKKKVYNKTSEFVNDVNLVFENAMEYNEPQSLIYQDAVKLQKLFENNLGSASKPSLTTGSLSEEKLPYGNVTYSIGDYVYIQNEHPKSPPHIVLIEKLYMDDGMPYLNGTYFYRPEQTFHPATKKFYVNEVFKSQSTTVQSLSKVMGKCYVMFLRDYVKGHPEGYDKSDVYVCEAKYMDSGKSMQLIKDWGKTITVDAANPPKIITYPHAINLLKTVPSVHAQLEKREKEKEEGLTIRISNNPKRAGSVPSTGSEGKVASNVSAKKSASKKKRKRADSEEEVESSTDESYEDEDEYLESPEEEMEDVKPKSKKSAGKSKSSRSSTTEPMDLDHKPASAKSKKSKTGEAGQRLQQLQRSDSSTSIVSLSASQSSTPPGKRGRGRPRKGTAVVLQQEDEAAVDIDIVNSDSEMSTPRPTTFSPRRIHMTPGQVSSAKISVAKDTERELTSLQSSMGVGANSVGGYASLVVDQSGKAVVMKTPRADQIIRNIPTVPASVTGSSTTVSSRLRRRKGHSAHSEPIPASYGNTSFMPYEEPRFLKYLFIELPSGIHYFLTYTRDTPHHAISVPPGTAALRITPITSIPRNSSAETNAMSDSENQENVLQKSQFLGTAVTHNNHLLYPIFGKVSIPEHILRRMKVSEEMENPKSKDKEQETGKIEVGPIYSVVLDDRMSNVFEICVQGMFEGDDSPVVQQNFLFVS